MGDVKQELTKISDVMSKYGIPYNRDEAEDAKLMFSKVGLLVELIMSKNSRYGVDRNTLAPDVMGVLQCMIAHDYEKVTAIFGDMKFHATFHNKGFQAFLYNTKNKQFLFSGRWEKDECIDVSLTMAKSWLGYQSRYYEGFCRTHGIVGCDCSQFMSTDNIVGFLMGEIAKQ